MRQIGTIDNESQARIFRAYLLTLNIHSDVEQTRDRTWAVWVHEENRLDEAREELDRFMADPRNPIYVSAADEGRKLEKAREQEDRKFRERHVDLRTKWHTSQMTGGPLTLILILVSIATTVLMQFPQWGTFIKSAFSIMAYKPMGEYVVFSRDPLAEIKNGQIWRLVTPIFLHFGIMHILFNMLWLKLLGGAVEAVRGTKWLAIHVLVYAIAGNVIQFFMGGPLFGGMSGVNYGLFAYVWLVGKVENEPRYFIDSFNIGLMLFWFFACLFGIIPNVANGAHAGGLVLGALAAVIRLRAVPFTKIRF